MSQLRSFYDQVMEYLTLKYHTYPPIPKVHLSEEDKILMDQAESLGSTYAGEQDGCSRYSVLDAVETEIGIWEVGQD